MNRTVIFTIRPDTGFSGYLKKSGPIPDTLYTSPTLTKTHISKVVSHDVLITKNPDQYSSYKNMESEYIFVAAPSNFQNYHTLNNTQHILLCNSYTLLFFILLFLTHGDFRNFRGKIIHNFATIRPDTISCAPLPRIYSFKVHCRKNVH